MARRMLRLLLRSGAAQRQVVSAAEQQQQRIQAPQFSCLVAASTQCQLLQEHLWVQQQPWQLQQAQGVSQQQQLTSRYQHAAISGHRAFAAAADPARAIAETMAGVAQRKLADVQRQHAGLTAKMEGGSTVAHGQQELRFPRADSCSLLCTVLGGLATLSAT